MKYEKVAEQFVNAIREIASKPENLNNLESYLTYHFSEWLNKYAHTPADITSELKAFASMEF